MCDVVVHPKDMDFLTVTGCSYMGRSVGLAFDLPRAVYY